MSPANGGSTRLNAGWGWMLLRLSGRCDIASQCQATVRAHVLADCDLKGACPSASARVVHAIASCDRRSDRCERSCGCCYGDGAHKGRCASCAPVTCPLSQDDHMKSIKGHRIVRESRPGSSRAGCDSAIERAENEGWPIPCQPARPPVVRKHAAWLWLRGSSPVSWRVYRDKIAQARSRLVRYPPP